MIMRRIDPIHIFVYWLRVSPTNHAKVNTIFAIFDEEDGIVFVNLVFAFSLKNIFELG